MDSTRQDVLTMRDQRRKRTTVKRDAVSRKENASTQPNLNIIYGQALHPAFMLMLMLCAFASFSRG